MRRTATRVPQSRRCLTGLDGCISAVAAPGSPECAGAPPALALLPGLILLAMGVFRLGFLTNLLSHPVISGFIAASGLLIASGQLKHLLGVAAGGHSLFEMALSLAARLRQVHWPPFVIGAAAAGFLFWTHKGLKPAPGSGWNLPARGWRHLLGLVPDPCLLGSPCRSWRCWWLGF